MSLEKEIGMKERINSIGHEVLLNIVRTANFIDKRAQSFFLRFGLTQAQYNVLIVLKLEKKNLTQVEIGQRLVVSRAGITSILDKIEKKGYIRRQRIKSDRRVFEIGLTPAGKKIINLVEPHYLKEVEKTMRCLNEDENRQLNKSLGVLRKKLKG